TLGTARYWSAAIVTYKGAAAVSDHLGQLSFETNDLSEAAVTGSCGRVTSGCATGTGCYHWNPSGTACSVDVAVPSRTELTMSMRLRVATAPNADNTAIAFIEAPQLFGTANVALNTDATLALTVGWNVPCWSGKGSAPSLIPAGS